MSAPAVRLAGGTSIEWCDYTFNPWWGCEKVSPGCAHCYADTLARRRAPGQHLWGKDHRFRFFEAAHWGEPLKWARLAPAKLGRRPRVFCASMADVFEERNDLRLEGARRRLFGLILATPELDWLVLTKRPEFARDWLPEVESFALFEQWPIPNLWMGVSIENSRFTWRADVLREIPAAVRFISAEPLLGSLFQDRVLASDTRQGHSTFDAQSGPEAPRAKGPLELTGIDWVIVGGESGHGARPMRLEWAREIVDACLDHCTDRCECSDEPTNYQCSHRPAVFVKQLGSVLARELGAHTKGGDWDELPTDLQIREFPRSATA